MGDPEVHENERDRGRGGLLRSRWILPIRGELGRGPLGSVEAVGDFTLVERNMVTTYVHKMR